SPGLPPGGMSGPAGPIGGFPQPAGPVGGPPHPGAGQAAPMASAVPPIPALAASAVPPIPDLAAESPAAPLRGRRQRVLVAFTILAVLVGAGVVGWFLWGHRLRALLKI